MRYHGVAQVKKGCSIARAAAAKVGGPVPPTCGVNKRRADCGKYGHVGGEKVCSLYKEMEDWAEAQAEREAFIASLPPPERPSEERPAKAKGKPKAAVEKALYGTHQSPASFRAATAAKADDSDEEEGKAGSLEKGLR